MSVKLGYEAIEFAIRKWMTKNTKGIASIPGQAMKDKIKILVDKYAKQISMSGKDVNKVTVKQVDNAIDYGMALKKQQTKKASEDLTRWFDKTVGSPPKKEPTVESLLKGKEYIDEKGRSWVFPPGTKKKDLPEWTKGWTPKIVPKDDFASGGRIGYGLGDLVRKFTQEGRDEEIAKWLKDKGIDLTVEEWREKPFKEKLGIWGWRSQMWMPEMEKGIDYASGGIARVGMLMGGFTKAQVLIQMLKNTLKGSKDAYVKKNFPTFIKEMMKKPELANNPKVWSFFTNKLPKNQRLVVHSDDSVDFWKQSDFGPHNIETTNKFMKKHGFTRDEAVRIQNMSPEDQTLEMKRLETIRNRTKQASGGIAGELHLNEGGRARFQDGALAAFNDPMSQQDFYGQFWGVPYAGYEGQHFKTLQEGDPNYDEIRRSHTAGSFADLVNRGLIQRYEGPTDYKSYLDSVSTNVPGTPIVPTTQASTPVASTPDDLLTGDILGTGMTESAYVPLPKEKTLAGAIEKHSEEDKRIKEAVARGEITPEMGSKLGGVNAQEVFSEFLGPGSSLITKPALTAGALGYQGVMTRLAKEQEFQKNISPKTDLMQGDIDIGAPVTDSKLVGLMESMQPGPNVLERQGIGKTAKDFGLNTLGVWNAGSLPSGQRQQYENIIAGNISDPRMQAAQAKGMDARMGRTYAENIQAMADPRMGRTYAENIQAMADPRMRGAKGGLAHVLGV